MVLTVGKPDLPVRDVVFKLVEADRMAPRA